MLGVYLRVSAKDQKVDGQRDQIQQWLERNGHDLSAVRWYQDKETGRTLDRSAFNQLQADIFDGQIRTVVCWKLDRLARRLREGINLLADWCDRGVRVVSVTQQIDLSGAVGRMIAAVMLGLAEIELEQIKERQSAGIVVAKRRGVYKGRKRGTWKAKPERARKLRERGLQIAEIANSLRVSQATVYRYLKS